MTGFEGGAEAAEQRSFAERLRSMAREACAAPYGKHSDSYQAIAYCNCDRIEATLLAVADLVREAAARACEIANDENGALCDMPYRIRALPLPVQPPGSESREASALLVTSELHWIVGYAETSNQSTLRARALSALRALALDARPEEKK